MHPNWEIQLSVKLDDQPPSSCNGEGLEMNMHNHIKIQLKLLQPLAIVASNFEIQLDTGHQETNRNDNSYLPNNLSGLCHLNQNVLHSSGFFRLDQCYAVHCTHKKKPWDITPQVITLSVPTDILLLHFAPEFVSALSSSFLRVCTNRSWNMCHKQQTFMSSHECFLGNIKFEQWFGRRKVLKKGKLVQVLHSTI